MTLNFNHLRKITFLPQYYISFSHASFAHPRFYKKICGRHRLTRASEGVKDPHQSFLIRVSHVIRQQQQHTVYVETISCLLAREG